MIIDNKSKMYDLLLMGKLGNYHPHFKTYEEYINSGLDLTKLVCIRSLVPTGKFEYGVQLKDLKRHVDARDDDYLITPIADNDNDRVIQGEIYRSTEGLYLNYSYAQKQLREALSKDGLHVYRTEADQLLKYYLDNPSYESIKYLLDTYVDHVVEFTTYNHSCGVFGYNTIIWEVRKY